MRLISWNVASVRARLPRVLELLEDLRPDALALQETKCAPAQIPREALAEAGYAVVDHSGGPWNGVAILAPVGTVAGTPAAGATPLPEGTGGAAASVDAATGTTAITDPGGRASGEPDPWGGPRAGLPGEVDPAQARWVEATVGGIRVASVYVVNGKALDHPDYEAKLSFLRAMGERVRELAATGPVMVLGDMNVCPTDEDCWDPARFVGSTHTSEPERASWRGILEAADLVDAHVHHGSARADGVDGKNAFTWWDYRGGSFHRGFGLRIDHALVDRATASRVSSVWVARDYRKGHKPSDHAPLVVDLDG
ncbi:MAG: exodeoxyribonuclease III [Solirubrobacteraceae bacterium]